MDMQQRKVRVLGVQRQLDQKKKHSCLVLRLENTNTSKESQGSLKEFLLKDAVLEPEDYQGMIDDDSDERPKSEKQEEYAVVGPDPGIHNTVTATTLDTETPSIAKNITILHGSLKYCTLYEWAESSEEHSIPGQPPRQWRLSC
ncbi:hypothetical protein BGX26_002614 [Mortierella sp. AD094]|nr:hypothetical protein BGX26_002614 [Mortierella sp. AD094]